jgi:predicted DNA-binding transcriptional regulator AlpA
MNNPNHEYLPAQAVWERYGVSSMTGWRWLHREDMKFPRPVYIGRFRYFRVTELQQWERGLPREMQKAG